MSREWTTRSVSGASYPVPGGLYECSACRGATGRAHRSAVPRSRWATRSANRFEVPPGPHHPGHEPGEGVAERHDEVGDDVANGPARAERRGVPLGFGQAAELAGQVSALRGEERCTVMRHIQQLD